MKKKRRRRIISEQFYWLVNRRLEGAEDPLVEWALAEGLLKESEMLDTLVSFAAGVNILKRNRKKDPEARKAKRRDKRNRH